MWDWESFQNWVWDCCIVWCSKLLNTSECPGSVSLNTLLENNIYPLIKISVFYHGPNSWLSNYRPSISNRFKNTSGSMATSHTQLCTIHAPVLYMRCLFIYCLIIHKSFNPVESVFGSSVSGILSSAKKWIIMLCTLTALLSEHWHDVSSGDVRKWGRDLLQDVAPSLSGSYVKCPLTRCSTDWLGCDKY